jgi:thiamine-phosphate pyrophosphorylase
LRGLYAICDVDTLRARGVDVLAFSRAVLAAGPCALQLRAKSSPDEERLALLEALRPLCRAASVPLICNDRPDLARAASCDGVHLGQEDLGELHGEPPGPLSVGVSTHTLDQLERALAIHPAYVAYGPVFSTRTKKDASPTVGIDELARANELARASGTPLVAIGGITLDTAPAVGARASAVAVISDLLGPTPHDPSTVTARAAAFRLAVPS